jgi:hypothetical protein
MLIKDHYAALGVKYNTLSSMKKRYRFDTIEETYQYWRQQKELKQQKKADLARIAKQLGINEGSVRVRMHRRGHYKIDDSLLETKWKNRFEYEGETLALGRQCNKYGVNECTAYRHYKKTGDWVAAMNKAREVRKMGLRGGYKSETSLECEKLGLNYKRVVSCAYRRQITKQQAIDYCLKLDAKK